MKASTHLRAALLLLALFLASGLLLEAALGARAEAYLGDPLRREFLRLAHAHGALLALVNVALASAMARLETPEAWARAIRWGALSGALAVGLGFAGGGLWHGPTDPGPLVLFVPAGAFALLSSLVLVAISKPSDRAPRASDSGARDDDAS